MRRIHHYKVFKESFEDMIKANRFNPSLEILFRDKNGKHVCKISAGYDDIIHVYREDADTFILSLNPGLGYVGLEVLEGSEKAGRIFLQGYQVKEILGRDDLAPLTIIKRLKNYVYSH